jgi:hypothetical protein
LVLLQARKIRPGRSQLLGQARRVLCRGLHLTLQLQRPLHLHHRGGFGDGLGLDHLSHVFESEAFVLVHEHLFNNCVVMA